MDWGVIGAILKVPSGVATMVDPAVPVGTNAGRALKEPVPNKSWPTVTLKGDPEEATRNGLRLIRCGRFQFPISVTRFRTSNPARP